MYHINVVLARSFYERGPPASRPGREHIEQRQGHRGPLEREPPELGLNLVQSNGPGAAQSVGHFHIHVLPRELGDELLVNWPLKPGDMPHIAEIAERIRSFL